MHFQSVLKKSNQQCCIQFKKKYIIKMAHNPPAVVLSPDDSGHRYGRTFIIQFLYVHHLRNRLERGLGQRRSWRKRKRQTVKNTQRSMYSPQQQKGYFDINLVHVRCHISDHCDICTSTCFTAFNMSTGKSQ